MDTLVLVRTSRLTPISKTLLTCILTIALCLFLLLPCRGPRRKLLIRALLANSLHLHLKRRGQHGRQHGENAGLHRSLLPSGTRAPQPTLDRVLAGASLRPLPLPIRAGAVPPPQRPRLPRHHRLRRLGRHDVPEPGLRPERHEGGLAFHHERWPGGALQLRIPPWQPGTGASAHPGSLQSLLQVFRSGTIEGANLGSFQSLAGGRLRLACLVLAQRWPDVLAKEVPSSFPL